MKHVEGSMQCTIVGKKVKWMTRLCLAMQGESKMDDQALFGRMQDLEFMGEGEGSKAEYTYFIGELSQLHTVLLGLVQRYTTTISLSADSTVKELLTVLQGNVQVEA